jgi:hypothetical protein
LIAAIFYYPGEALVALANLRLIKTNPVALAKLKRRQGPSGQFKKIDIFLY